MALVVQVTIGKRKAHLSVIRGVNLCGFEPDLRYTSRRIQECAGLGTMLLHRPLSWLINHRSVDPRPNQRCPDIRDLGPATLLSFLHPIEFVRAGGADSIGGDDVILTVAGRISFCGAAAT